MTPAQKEAFSKWKTNRSRGAESFKAFLLRGIGMFGFPMAVLLWIVKYGFDDRFSFPAKIVVALVITLAGGALFGVSKWFMNERNFARAQKMHAKDA